MASRYEIKKNYQLIKIQTGFIAIIAFILFLITSSIVRAVDNFIPANTATLSLIIRLIALGVAILSVSTTWMIATRKRYYIEDGRLVIQSGKLYGSQSQEVIMPQHASKIRLVRTPLGNKLGYGTVIIEVDSFSRKSVYQLKNILEPEKVIKELQSKL